MKRINTGPTAQLNTNQPNAGSVPKPRYLTFGWKHFRQEKYFGLGGAPDSWFVSLFEKLRDLSKELVSRFQEEPAFKSHWRIHPVVFDADCPVTRQELMPLLSEESEIQQFQITKALGRVIGFFDENSVFQIIVLDPQHNMQPSNYNNYTLRPTTIAKTEYELLRLQIDLVRQRSCGETCASQRLLDALPENHQDNIVLLSICDADLTEVRKCLATKSQISLANIFLAGLIKTT